MLVLPESYRNLKIVPPAEDDCNFLRGVIDENGHWGPLLTPKGYDGYNCTKRTILLFGSKLSGKTVTLAAKFLKHCWEVDNAKAGMVACSQGNAKIGSWYVLTEIALAGYLFGNFGMRIVAHKHDPSSKMEYYVITNAHYDPQKHGGEWDDTGRCKVSPTGGISKFFLLSLNNEKDVLRKFKSAEFSLVWMTEADQFKDVLSFNTLSDQLRGIGTDDEKRQFLLDANPPEEGEYHWLHAVFWDAADPTHKDYNPDFQEEFARFEFTLDDNPFLPEAKNKRIKLQYKPHPAQYQRFVLGKMVRDATGGAFADVFLFGIHVVGKAQSSDPADWEVLVPGPRTSLLLTGTDPGDISHAASFIAVRYNEKNEMCFDLFDELCFIEKPVTITEFLGRLIKKVDKWSEWMTATYGSCPVWHHHADSQVFQFDPRAGNDALLFHRMSEKRMHFIADVDGQKRKGAVMQRIAMMRRLLFECRYRMSAHCRANIDAITFIRDSKSWKGVKAGFNKNDKRHTHPLAATSYCLEAELPLEMLEESEPVAGMPIGISM